MSTVYQEFKYGDIVGLRGNSGLVVRSPSGIATHFPVSVHRVQRFRVEELGTWSYEWEDGMTGKFVVVPTRKVSEKKVQTTPRVKAQTSFVLTGGGKFLAFL